MKKKTLLTGGTGSFSAVLKKFLTQSISPRLEYFQGMKKSKMKYDFV